MERSSKNSLILALLLIGAGAVLLGFNTGWLAPEWSYFFYSWPMLLLVIGIIMMIRGKATGGSIVALVGIFFLIPRAALIWAESDFYNVFVATYWPVLIIVLGLKILICGFWRPRRAHRRRHWRADGNCCSSNGGNNTSGGCRDGEVNYDISFGGVEQVIIDPVFRGGRITARFGGGELDFRRTTLVEKETYLYVGSYFGAVELTVPDNWEIEIRSRVFAGHVCDSRPKDTPRDTERKLIIDAECSFGAIEIK